VMNISIKSGKQKKCEECLSEFNDLNLYCKPIQFKFNFYICKIDCYSKQLSPAEEWMFYKNGEFIGWNMSI